MQVLKARAEAHVGETVDRAVIAVPARFNAEQRLATMEAGMLAGIERVALLQVLSPQAQPQWARAHDCYGFSFAVESSNAQNSVKYQIHNCWSWITLCTRSPVIH